MLPKIVLTDIDGVWTDGGMYYDESGNEFKKFHTYDSAGILFCKLLKVPVVIITGENSKAVGRRAKKLKIEYLFLGAKSKVPIIQKLLDELVLDWSEAAYIGDDINDYELLKKVGLSACPSSAPEYIKEIVDWKLDKPGGKGVFREFVEKIMKENSIDVIQLLTDFKLENQ